MPKPKNREILRQLLSTSPPYPDICEWDPLRQMPASLKDPYHGIASVRLIAVVDGEPCHVCEECAEQLSAGLLRRSSGLSPGAELALRLAS